MYEKWNLKTRINLVQTYEEIKSAKENHLLQLIPIEFRTVTNDFKSMITETNQMENDVDQAYL